MLIKVSVIRYSLFTNDLLVIFIQFVNKSNSFINKIQQTYLYIIYT